MSESPCDTMPGTFCNPCGRWHCGYCLGLEPDDICPDCKNPCNAEVDFAACITDALALIDSEVEATRHYGPAMITQEPIDDGLLMILDALDPEQAFLAVLQQLTTTGAGSARTRIGREHVLSGAPS